MNDTVFVSCLFDRRDQVLHLPSAGTIPLSNSLSSAVDPFSFVALVNVSALACGFSATCFGLVWLWAELPTPAICL